MIFFLFLFLHLSYKFAHIQFMPRIVPPKSHRFVVKTAIILGHEPNLGFLVEGQVCLIPPNTWSKLVWKITHMVFMAIFKWKWWLCVKLPLWMF